MSDRNVSGPLAAALVDPVREESLGRMWRNIAARRERRGDPKLALRWLLVGIATSLAFAAAAFVLWPRSAHTPTVAAAGPLLRADGRAVASVEVPLAGRVTRLELADGSHVDVEPGARLEPLASSSSEFVVRLAHGDARFDVIPGGPRRWIVEAGLARVEVVGTHFVVARSERGVRVSVERGVVLVRSLALQDGIARVEAGQSVEVRRPDAGAPEPPPASSSPAPARLAPREPGWREEAARGHHAQAYALLGAEGLEREATRVTSSEDLFALADVARLSGHPERARAPLERLLEMHAGDSRAPLAAVTLGRIELDAGRPERAANAFERALALGAPRGLEEDIRVRLVESYARAHDSAGALTAGNGYERAFPEGRRRAEVQRWLGALEPKVP